MISNLVTRRRALWLAALAIGASCTAGVDSIVGPLPRPVGPVQASTAAATAPLVVISQVYGGGSNTGATYKNDYIELYNAGATDVSLAGWSVQYASSTGTSWQVSSLSGTIAAGHYFLIQEVAGTSGTAAMASLTADVVPMTVFNMSATAGKVALLSTTTALTGGATGAGGLGGGTCPTNASAAGLLDFAGYGTTATCFEGTGPAPGPSSNNTTATFRKSNGTQDTNINSADFAVATAAPRNSGTAGQPVAVATISPAAPQLTVGGTTTFTVAATLSGQPVTITSTVWSSSTAATATIDAASGVATAVAAGTTTITAVAQTASGPLTATTTLTVNVPVGPPVAGLVISQVYGGGGNSGATLKNDFIELYNGSANTVSLDGWSVQYASSTTATWFRTPLTGSVASGHYFLIQEGAGANAAALPLPTPDLLSGNDSIAMGAGAGKIALVRSATLLTASCPTTDANVIDFVGYGAANCSEGNVPTGTLSASAAALRKDGGRQDTNNNGADFNVGTPMPRNASSDALPPLSVLSTSIAPANSAVLVGATVTYTAPTSQFGTAVAVTSAAWTSSNAAVATIDAASGVATTHAVGTTTIGVTVTTAAGTASATTTLTVSSAPVLVTVSPLTWTLKAGLIRTFIASATDVNGAPTSSTYAWTSSNAAVATIDAASGVATGIGYGTATITATSSNSIIGTATIIVTVGNISVQPRVDPLPVGFQTQLFLPSSGGTDSRGTPVFNSDVTWSSADPGIVSANAVTGVITAVRQGSVSITATAKTDGVSTGSTTITTNIGTLSASARTGHNTELGIPKDADPSDDIIVSRRQYTLSYSAAHGGPNWVSWNLDATHKGGASRCNCFTADTALVRSGITPFETNDWVNGGIWSRGHMSPSADWADTDGDNAPTFFLSNMIPQNQTANAGAWGDMENYLRTLATGNAEIYIVAGPIFTRNRTAAGVDGFGFMNSTGHIAVPDSMWKVAIVVPDGRSASGITAPADVQVIAVNMANAATSVGNWTNYTTTIDKIQRSTGYDLLSALPENVQCRIEVRNCAPLARITGDGLGGGSEGQTLAFSAATSSDADGDAVSYAWDINGAAAGSDASLSHTFANNGVFTVHLVVNDGHGGTGSATSTVTVSNVVPSVASFAGASILEGGSYAATSSFADPGDDNWSATVNYGDGTGAQSLTLIADKTFALAHVYRNNGTFQVTVRVTEGTADAAAGEYSATVSVANVVPTVAAFANGSIAEGGSYAAAGSFVDPGDDLWTATVNYGDGSGPLPLTLNLDKTFSVSHVYADNGSYQVTVRITEGTPDAAIGEYTATVAVANVAPTVVAFPGGSILESGSYTATGSFTDPGDDHWTATVNYGDGSGSQPLALNPDKTFSLSHVYADNGSYPVTVRVVETDVEGATGQYVATVSVANVSPSVASFAGATILRGEQYASAGTFTDPGADTWTATVNYGDGSGSRGLTLVGMSFQLAHGYTIAGVFTAAVTVTDKDSGAGTGAAIVTVLSATQGVGNLSGMVTSLSGLNNGELNSLRAKLDAATAQLARNNANAASGQLNAFLNEVSALVKSGRLDSATAAPIVAYAQRVIASIGG